MKAVSYNYPIGGGYADTVAMLDNGGKAWINVQYETVTINGGAELSDTDKAALISDARINGKFGYAPLPKPTSDDITDLISTHAHNGPCHKCGTYCDGDCSN